MVGGVIVEVAEIPQDRDTLYVDCHAMVGGIPRNCAVLVKRSPGYPDISFGDWLWWRGRNAYWTPAMEIKNKQKGGFATGATFDIPVKLAAAPGVKRPFRK